MNGPGAARLSRLLEANRLAVEHLDLALALRQIIEAAVELSGARYGAVGVLGTDGELDQFIHTGMDDATVARIGTTPRGRGLLGALIDDPRPVRLAALAADVRSVGVPAHHPPIVSFLGVPLEVRGETYGHLHLADPRPDAFSADDQELVEALATTAGVAIAHARLFEESRRRERWTAATTEITDELLTDDGVDALQLVVDRVRVLADADLVAVVLTHGRAAPFTGVVVDRASGAAAASLVGQPLPADDTIVLRCLGTGLPQLVAELDHAYPGTTSVRPAGGPAMAVPLPADVGVRGSLLVLRSAGSARFAEFDLDVASSLAGHAALALDRADVRAARAELAALEVRDRIARDLHDHVVQRLFAVGLNVQAVSGMLGAGAASERLELQIDEIDATIRQIRTTIFGLQAPRSSAEDLRTQVTAVAIATSVALARPPEVVFRGPVALLVPPELHADVVAVVREALTNVGRHAGAQHVRVLVAASVDEILVEVVDDGRGMPGETARSGLANLRSRATDRGGSFTTSGRSGPGTRLRWSVPLRAVASSAPA